MQCGSALGVEGAPVGSRSRVRKDEGVRAQVQSSQGPDDGWPFMSCT